jgi:hypothetical protein
MGITIGPRNKIIAAVRQSEPPAARTPDLTQDLEETRPLVYPETTRSRTPNTSYFSTTATEYRRSVNAEVAAFITEVSTFASPDVSKISSKSPCSRSPMRSARHRYTASMMTSQRQYPQTARSRAAKTPEPVPTTPTPDLTSIAALLQ